MICHRRCLVVLSVSVLTLLLAALPAAAQPRKRNVLSDGYIVVYENSVRSPGQETEQRERSRGFKSRFRYSSAIKGFAAKLSAGQVARLKADPEVDYVVPDRVVRAEATLAAGEPLPPTGIRRIEAASSTHVHGASRVNVAVIDTGVHLSHPDLNVAAGKNCVSAGASPNDDNGHGTHVAGTIAARNNGSGAVGVAPGTKVFAAKVLNAQGSGTASQVICGIDWVTSTRTDSDPANDISVANMSLGGVGSPIKSCATTTDPEHQAICRSTQAGVSYAVAAGNDGWDFDYAPAPDTPAAYPEALTVSAVSDSDGVAGAGGGAPSCRTGESDDRYASFSNYALTSAGAAHTIAAPGVCIKSTWMSGGYSTISGTSMATPHMAGVVALCLGEEGGPAPAPCAGLSPAQIIAKLRSDAQGHTGSQSSYGFNGDPLRPVGSRYYGYLTRVGVEGSPPPPPSVKSYSPLGYSPLTGSVYSSRGAVSRLASNDGSRVEITAANQSGAYVSEIQPYATISQAELGTLRKLTVDYDGNVSSSSASLTVQVYNFATGTWQVILAPTTGVTSDRPVSWTNSSSPASYVDPATRTVRVRVRATRTGGSFRTRTDWVRLRIEH